ARGRASSLRRAGFLRSRPGRRDPLSGYRTRERRSAAREFAIVSLAGLASFLFLNHQNLYLREPFALSNAPIEAYFLATIVIYLFLRMLIIAAEMRPTRARRGEIRCPECGQRLDILTAAGRGATRRMPSNARGSVRSAVVP